MSAWGEGPTPTQRIPAEEKAKKEGQVLRNPLDTLTSHWNGKAYEGARVTSVLVYNDDDTDTRDYDNSRKPSSLDTHPKLNIQETA